MSERAITTWRFDAPVDQKAALAVCEAVAFGRELSDIERDPAFPPRDLFISWVMRDPQVALLFTRAREMSAYAYEDEAISVLRAKLAAPGSAQDLRAADLFVQQLRWSASARNPQVYSPRSNVQVTVPIQINTSLDMGKGEVSLGTKEFPNIYHVTAEVTREVELPPEPDTPKLTKREKERRGRLRGPQKRVLTPRVETAVERETRLRAYKLAGEQRAARLRARMAAKAAIKKVEEQSASSPHP